MARPLDDAYREGTQHNIVGSHTVMCHRYGHIQIRFGVWVYGGHVEGHHIGQILPVLVLPLYWTELDETEEVKES